MIEKIRLKNFKCFEDETFQLSSLNIWTGLNGMGKSSVIQALLLMRQNYELGMLQSDRGISLNGELVQLGNAKDALYQYYREKEIGIEFFFQNQTPASWKWDAETDGDHLPFKAKTSNFNDFAKSSIFGPAFHYLGAERLGPRVFFKTANFQVINKNQLGIQGEYTANYLAEFQNIPIPIKELKHPHSTGLTLKEQVDSWLGEIRPGTRINITSNLEMSIVGLRYQFIGGNDAGNPFRPTNVGFGLSYLLPVVVAILSSQPGTLIILENPEAHLHPRGQAEIGKMLSIAAANGVQIIVETHSDHILNGVRVAVKRRLIKPRQTQLLYFTGIESDNQFKHYILGPKIDENGRIDQWPEGFFDEWERQLNELL